MRGLAVALLAVATSACARVIPDVTTMVSLPAEIRASGQSALLMLIRPAGEYPFSVVTVIDAGGRVVATVPGESVVTLSMPPGQIELFAIASPKLVVRLGGELQPGRVHVVRLDLRSSGLGAELDARVVHKGTSPWGEASRESLTALTVIDPSPAQQVLDDSWDTAAVMRAARESFAAAGPADQNDRTFSADDARDSM